MRTFLKLVVFFAYTFFRYAICSYIIITHFPVQSAVIYLSQNFFYIPKSFFEFGKKIFLCVLLLHTKTVQRSTKISIPSFYSFFCKKKTLQPTRIFTPKYQKKMQNESETFSTLSIRHIYVF